VFAYAFIVKEDEPQGAPGDLRGVPLYAAARLFEEFDLLFNSRVILSLKYAFNAATEQQGATSFHCEYGSARWALQHLQSGFLQADTYRVLRGDNIVATFLGRWAFLPAELIFADGTSLICIRGLYRTTIRDADGNKIASARVKWAGSLLGSSVICVEQTAKSNWITPLLLILLHLTTHQRN